MMGDVCGVIFDLDGTVADTLRDIAEGVNFALAATGRERISVEAVRGHVGHGVHDLMSGAGGTSDEGEIAELVGVFRGYYAEHYLDHTSLYPGAAELLDALAERGHPMSVLSNKPHDFTVRMVERLMGRWRFAAVDGGRDGVPLKPDPTAALVQAERMGRRAEDVVFVGDSVVDFETAENAGMRSVLVTWGFTSGDVLRECAGAVVCDSVDGVLSVLISS